VNDLFVHRDANGRRKATITLEGRLDLEVLATALSVTIDLSRTDSGCSHSANLIENLRHSLAGLAHLIELFGGLQADHEWNFLPLLLLL
jgi:hypothetical protein